MQLPAFLWLYPFSSSRKDPGKLSTSLSPALHTSVAKTGVAYKLLPTQNADMAVTHGRQAGGVEGIVNGMDTTDWSPNVDKFLDVKYDADTVDEGKALAKETLQAELGLPVSTCASQADHLSLLH